MLLFSLFLALILFLIIFILCINDSDEKRCTKYRGFDVMYDSKIEKHRKIIKIQKRILFKQNMYLFLKKGFKK